MSRELSDVLIILVAILIPTIAIVASIAFPKWLAHRERKNRIAAENRELRADLKALKSRVADVERVVTDDGVRLAKDIDALQLEKN